LSIPFPYRLPLLTARPQGTPLCARSSSTSSARSAASREPSRTDRTGPAPDTVAATAATVATLKTVDTVITLTVAAASVAKTSLCPRRLHRLCRRWVSVRRGWCWRWRGGWCVPCTALGRADSAGTSASHSTQVRGALRLKLPALLACPAGTLCLGQRLAVPGPLVERLSTSYPPLPPPFFFVL